MGEVLDFKVRGGVFFFFLGGGGGGFGRGLGSIGLNGLSIRA